MLIVWADSSLSRMTIPSPPCARNGSISSSSPWGSAAGNPFQEYVGGKLNDIIGGSNNYDTLVGGEGDDTIGGAKGDGQPQGRCRQRTLCAAMRGGITSSGWIGNDTLEGGADSDVLDGGDGDDTMAGGDGADQLTPGLGINTADGGAGSDIAFIDANFADVVLNGADGVMRIKGAGF